MIMLIKDKSCWLALMRFFAVSLLMGNIAISQAQILDDKTLESADAQILQKEIDVFTTIERGIALSVAECELLETCNASVNRGEVEQLISKIDDRVNALSLRYTENGDASLEGVLVNYADVRDSYKAILEKMGSLPQFAQQQETTDEFAGDDFFTAGTSKSNALPDNLMQLFQDADEEILDDATDDSTAPASTQ